MEATKKTTTTRIALLVAAALSMLLSGLFVATASQSDATPPPACPDGFNLTADGKNCFADSVLTDVDNPNSCAEGTITPDGTKCYVPARVIPQEGVTSCPKGYSPDDSLGGMCTRFEPASQNADTCPEGSFGEAGNCYTRVAKGPDGAPVCANGTLAGDQCEIEGDAPVPGPGQCPTSTVVFEEAGSCFSVLSPNPDPVCSSGYVQFAETSTVIICKVSNPNPDDASLAAQFSCPTPPSNALNFSADTHMLASVTKITSCVYELARPTTPCPAGADLGLVNGQCRKSVAISGGDPVCQQAGFGLVGTRCVRYEVPVPVAAQCPNGSVEDGDGICRKPVKDEPGTYYCKDADAALNGKSCVYTTGFLVEESAPLYKCDKGTRAVIGDNVICFLGDADANQETARSCLQGVLSTDGLYCIVPRIDTAPAAAAVAAPVPSFTG